MICDKCFKETHIGHHNECKPLDNQRIQNFLDNSYLKLKDHQNKVESLMDHYKVIKGQLRQITGSEYLNYAKDVKLVISL